MRENAGDLCRADRSGMRQVSEPGGRLLVGLGAPGGALAEAVGRHRDMPRSRFSSAPPSKARQPERMKYGCSRGLAHRLFALIRRISWRRFERVDQFRTGAFGWLKYCVWPRPPWFYLSDNGEGDKL